MTRVTRSSYRLRYAREFATASSLPRRALMLDHLRALVELHPAILSVSMRMLPSHPPPAENEEYGPSGTNPL